MKKTYSTGLYHGMTFQQIMFQAVGKAVWWNLIFAGFIWWDASLSGWTWINYTLIGFFAFRAVVNFFMASWIAKQPADRNIKVAQSIQ